MRFKLNHRDSSSFKIKVDVIARMLRRWTFFLLGLPRPFKYGLVLISDIVLCVLTVWLAFYLRLGVFVSLSGTVIFAVVFSVLLMLPIFITSGLYRVVFSSSGLPAMIVLARAMMIYGLAFAAAFTFWGVEDTPRTVGLIQPILMFLMVGASRMLARVWLGGAYRLHLRKRNLPKALIYGAGSAGRQLANAIALSPKIKIVGFLDDDHHLQGQLLNGLTIFNPADLAEILSDLSITDVILALPSVSRQRRNEILNNLKPHNLAVRTLPSLGDIATGKVGLSDVHELDIHDLLGRNPVKPNQQLLMLNNHCKTVLVTGAGGSIGSELCRQILKTNPKRLLLVEMSEYALYQIHQELQALMLIKCESLRGAEPVKYAINEIDSSKEINDSCQQNIEILPLLASVCDEMRMQEIMKTWKPDTVYHAAAYKHLSLVEQNPAEGVRNNVWGTWICTEVAIRNGVSNFVLISTDKAVRPSSIMGASKRLAEMVLQAKAEFNETVDIERGSMPSAKTKLSMVRFGNVLDSSGSVVPLFREQIKNGGPITLTHSDITRYFMTIPEAAQLVIQAGAMSQGGDVFLLDMGEPIKIIDLARRMVELSGFRVRDELCPVGDIEIILTGLRPGEKLYEELLIGGNAIPTSHPQIMKAQEQFLSWHLLVEKLKALNNAMQINDVPGICALLKQIIRDCHPGKEVVDLVYMAPNKEVLMKE